MAAALSGWGEEAIVGRMSPADQRCLGCARLSVKDYFPLPKCMLHDDALDAERPFQSVQRFPPEAPVGAFSGIGRVGGGLALTPNSHNASMDEVDAPPSIKRVQTLDHVVRLAWTRRSTVVGSISRAVAACDEGRHRPEPGLFGAAERIRAARKAYGGSACHTHVCKGRHRDLSFLGTRGGRTNAEHKTIGCNFTQELRQLFFLFPSAQNPIRLAASRVARPSTATSSPIGRPV